MFEQSHIRINDEATDINATSLRGYLDMPYDEVVEVLGEPMRDDSFDNKIDAIWTIESNEPPVVATLYNYEDGQNYNGPDGTPTEELSNWHIGGGERSIELVRWLFRERVIKVTDLYDRGVR